MIEIQQLKIACRGALTLRSRVALSPPPPVQQLIAVLQSRNCVGFKSSTYFVRLRSRFFMSCTAWFRTLASRSTNEHALSGNKLYALTKAILPYRRSLIGSLAITLTNLGFASCVINKWLTAVSRNPYILMTNAQSSSDCSDSSGEWESPKSFFSCSSSFDDDPKIAE